MNHNYISHMTQITHQSWQNHYPIYAKLSSDFLNAQEIVTCVNFGGGDVSTRYWFLLLCIFHYMCVYSMGDEGCIYLIK